MFAVLTAAAEYELELCAERQASGLHAATPSEALQIDAVRCLIFDDKGQKTCPPAKEPGLTGAVGALVQLVADAVLRVTGPSTADHCHTAWIRVAE